MTAPATNTTTTTPSVNPCGDGCSTETGTGVEAHGPAVRKVLLLSVLSLAWMTAEGGLGLFAGLSAHSVSLVGWALGSVLEGLASVIVIWRFTGTRRLSLTSERRARRAVAVSFWLLAPYIAVEAVRDLLGGNHVRTSLLGIGVTASSLLVMPALGIAKTRLARHLDSDATAGEGTQNLLCAAQAAAVLVGLGIHAVTGVDWVDPGIALALAAWAVREGREAWRGQDCC
ncbi:MAG: cation transporter [Actinomycetota bacterium]|nr:cation transporter [Actinomycetota bacterium]